MKNTDTDIMQYLDGMQIINHDIMDNVEKLYNNFDYNIITENDVKIALSKDVLNITDFATLLSPIADKFLEDMAVRAKAETHKNIGKTINVYTPL